MKRKITERLLAWKNTKNKKPLMLFGARQTGKTTSVLSFGRAAYRDVVHIDFYKQPHLKAAFQGSLEPSVIIIALEALLKRDIDTASTLLFLDEIQDCDEAITSLKFFRTDMPDLDVIAAGSLLGVHVARTGSFPVGHVDMLTMAPMDFEEFCWGLSETRSFDMVRALAATYAPCPIHDHMLDLYREYLMVGGMPEAVQTYADHRSLERARDIQRNIETAYVADMAKYAASADASKIIACWQSLPSQLAKETDSTKFSWSLVASGANRSRYGDAVDWLAAAGLVNRCTQVSDGTSPLKSFENAKNFKLYVADTGLLACAYNAQPSDLDGTDHRSARFRGGIAENYVMQQLVATGLEPYYWGVQSKGEVEFVLGVHGYVVPIEVKSKRNVTSPSVLNFAEKYQTEDVIRISARNFGKTDRVRSVPLYAAPLIRELIENQR